MGDRIHVVAVGQTEDESVALSGDAIPGGWTCTLSRRSADDCPEPGTGLFVRVLDVIPEARAVRVTRNEFGFEHLNEKRRERYLGSLELVAKFLQQGSTRTDAAVADAISEVKGMFTQCQRKNQRAWYRVWKALEEPSRSDAARWSRHLDELRHSLGDRASFGPSALDLVRSELPETLRHAAKLIRAEGRAIAAGRTIDDLCYPSGRTACPATGRGGVVAV